MVTRMERSHFGVSTVLAAVVLLLLLAGSSGAAVGDTTLVSVDSSGVQANAFSSYGPPSVSADGRYVAFVSDSSNLVPNDTNNFRDVFVRDLREGTTQRVSVSSSGTQANEAIYGYGVSISADGRHVAFLSLASNLVEDDTNGFVDVFVRDLQEDTTQRVSVGTSGTQANQSSFGHLSVSADGRYVAFSSWASNLLPNGWDSTGGDVFVRDRNTDSDEFFDEAEAVSTERVSWAQFQSWSGNGQSFAPSISADGRHVAFFSTSSNLVGGDANNATDVFVRDRQTWAIQRLRVDCAYSVCNTTIGGHNTSISADGRHVAFHLPDSNLMEVDTNGFNDVFVSDLQTGVTEKVSVSSSGAQANGASSNPKITPNGCYVAFQSLASNLVEEDSNGFSDVFVHHRISKTTQRVSVGGSGIQANRGSNSPGISADGRFVAFSSAATNLVEGDTNDFSDVFLHERSGSPSQTGDCTAPTTTANATTESGATYFSGSYTNEAVEVSFSAQDNEGGSGLKEIRYSATGAQSIPESVYDGQNPPVISTEGTTTISYFAIDNAGNHESPAKTFTVRVDRSAPPVPVITGPADNSFDTDGDITLSGTAEAGSRIEVFEVTASGVISKGTVGPVNLDGTWSKTLEGISNGHHTYQAKALDFLGNASGSSNARTVIVDKIKPKVSSTNPLAGATGVPPTGNVSATFSEAMDAGSLRDATTLRSATFTLAKKNSDGTTTRVMAKVSYDAETKKAVLDPDAGLVRGARYVATVTSKAKDLAGNSLDQNRTAAGDQPKTWVFTVRT